MLNISSISSAAAQAARVAMPKGEAAEGAGPDNDGDADDTKVAAPAVKAAPPAGMGTKLDMSV